MTWSLPLPVTVAAGSVGFDGAGNSLWLAGTDGRIVTVRLYDRSIRIRGGGYDDPVAVVPLDDGLQVAVVERSGTVWATARDRADKVNGRAVWTSADGAVAAVLGTDGRVLVLTGGAPLTVTAIDVATGVPELVVDDASEATALALDDAGATLLLLTPAANGAGSFVRRVALATGDAVDVPVASPAPVAVTAAPLGANAAIVADGTHLALVPTAGGPGPTVTVPAPVVALARWGQLVLAITSTDLHTIEWDLDAGPVPTCVEPGLLFVGGWSTLTVDLRAAGLGAGDIEWSVDEGNDIAMVSAGVEPPNPDGTQRLALLAAFRPGEFTLRARAITTGDPLAAARFRVTSVWPNGTNGPPVAVTGQHATFAGGAWGGGGAGPQNIPPHPAAKEWRVALVFVDTKGAVPPPTPTAPTWIDRLVGPGTSAARYYEEISFYDGAAPPGGRSGTTIRQSGANVFGPLSVDRGWGDLFEPIDPKQLWRGWNPKRTTWQDLAGAFCDWLSDQPGDPRKAVLSATDAIVFIVRNASKGPVMVGKDTLPAEYVWPQALGADVSWSTPATSTYTQRSMPIVFMPDGFPLGMPAAEEGFDPGPTLCHELGHTLGLDDLYNAGKLFTAEVTDRIATDVDLMCSSRPLPDMSISNRMRLGWIAPSWIEVVDFAANSAARTIALRSVETTGPGGPPPGTKTAVEVRIRDGWNYYFEHRHLVPGQVGDQNLTNVNSTAIPGGRMVLGTDVYTPGKGEPSRPPILLLPKDAGGDGPMLFTNGTDYQETDVSNPGRAYDFTLRYLGTDPADPQVVRVSLEHIEARRPQLQIRPAPGGTDFKSPDIDVIGPAGANALVKGAPHTVVARVTNIGNVEATDVLVHLRWLPFTTSSGSWTSLTDPARQTIPPGATRTFTAAWTPPADLKIDDVAVEHFCVRVDVDKYVDPVDAAHNEVTVFDNWAQSNFDTTTAAHGSPSERRRTAFEMANRLDVPATFTTHVDQSSRWFRTYIGQAWQRLEPGERRTIQLMYESLAGDSVHGADFHVAFTDWREEPNRVAITSRILVDDASECASSRTWWGAGLQIRPGRRCWFEDVEHQGELVAAWVMTPGPGGGRAPVAGGVVNLALWDERGESFLVTGQVGNDGRARVLLPNAVLAILAGGVELTGLLVRPEAHPFARAVSDAFPVQNR